MDLLDRALTDPFITSALKKAQEWNDLLETNTIGIDEARELISYLDHEWGSLLGAPVKVTGNITHLDAEGDTMTKFYEDVLATSNGFALYPPLQEGEPPVKGQKIVAHIYIPIAEEEKEQYEVMGIDETHLAAIAEVDKVSIVAAYGVSTERAGAWLSQFAPEVMEDIDDAVFNSDGSIGHIVERVQELDLTYEATPEEFEQACVCVAIYLKTVVDIESKLPYLTKMSGTALVTNAEEEEVPARLMLREGFVCFQDVSVVHLEQLTQDEDDASSNILDHIYMTALIINRNGGKDLIVKVPFDTLSSIESVNDLLDN